MPGMKMIVGLGNPGKKYAETRHNVGFKVIDMLGGVLGIEVNKSSFGGHLGKGEYAGNQVLLLKPQQYMNCSGQPVADAMGFYKIDLNDVLVVLDDMWLEPGQIRLRAKGSAGGHNGLTDVVEKLGTEEVPRLRVGIGQCRMGEAVGYVLSEPGPVETEQINQGISRAKDAVICWLEEGIGVAMTKHNSRLSDGQGSKD
jgi:peptidyl-tRNA hydrolase, PTH1 family